MVLKVLVGCERSQAITAAFRALGHEAYSCDLKPAAINSQWHFQEDIFELLERTKDFGWDLAIFHPNCQYLTVTGNKWFFHPDDKDLPSSERRPHPKFPDRLQKRKEAVKFFVKLARQKHILHIALENPVGVISTHWRKPNQIIQPYQFGHPEPKKTCLWLKNLPKLIPTKVVEPEYHITKSGKRLPKWYAYADQSKGQEHRAEIRSVTFSGIAEAIAKQWSEYIIKQKQENGRA